MKVHLTDIKRYDKDKEGNPLKTKDGRPYTRLVIKTDEYKDKLISGFDNQETKNWQVSQEVEIEVEQKGEYLNFRLPKKDDKMLQDIQELRTQITKLNLRVTVLEDKTRTHEDKVNDYPDLEIPDGEIPF